MRNGFVHARLSSFFLQFKKHKYIPKHIIFLCSGFGSLQCAACSKEQVLNLCPVLIPKGIVYVKANTEVWCYLLLPIYWLISKDSKWATDQSCMVWRFFFFNLCLHYGFRSCFSNGRRAGRKTWKGGEQECLLTSRSAHACSSLVGWNIITIILRRSLR